MADTSAPPRRSTRSAAKAQPPPIDAEQIRRMEEARLKAKAAAKLAQPTPTASAGTKRTYTSYNASNTPSTIRDAAAASPHKRDQNGFLPPPKDIDLIQPAKNFGRSEYIEYDFSKMTDTKGGFLSTTDDPHNKAMWTGTRGDKEDQKPEGISLVEWERERIRKKLRENRAGPFEPGISIMNAVDGRDQLDSEADIAAAEAAAEGSTVAAAPVIKGKYIDNLRDIKGKCRECNTLEIDWKWQDVFGIGLCPSCREKYPDKYSLLTKTEARDDYLLTDPELKDEDLLPHLERPNPHKTNWNNMQLFLRLQVETYAFSAAKWGSPEALDEEYEKRQKIAKSRKEKKFNKKLEDLKKKTRIEAYKRAKFGDGGVQAQFGDKIKFMGDKHVHEWGRSVLDPETGMTKKRCEECGMEVEELEF